MKNDVLVARRLIGIFVLGCMLLSYPVMTIFNVQGMVLGVPTLYLYIFALWLVLIFLVYCVLEKQVNRGSGSDADVFLHSDPQK